MKKINERKQLAATAAALAMLSNPANASVEGNLKSAARHTGNAVGSLVSAAGELAIDGAKLVGKGAVAAGKYAVDKAPDVADATIKLSKKTYKELEKMYAESQKLKPNAKDEDIQKYIDTLIVKHGPSFVKNTNLTIEFIKKHGSEGISAATEAAIKAGALASEKYDDYSPEAKKAFNNTIKTIKKTGIDQYKTSKARLKESAISILTEAIIKMI